MATVEDFNRWEQQAQGMTVDELLYAIQDARRAEDAMRGWNEERECYYSDQAATYAMALRKRR